MNTQLTHRPALSILAGIVLVLIILGAVFVNNYNISIQPKNPPVQGCTMDAKICPDGTAVGRMPPSCEFAPCPAGSTDITPVSEGPVGGEEGGGTASIVPVMPGESAMAKIPDLPLGALPDPSPPLTVPFTVEHRSALNTKRIALTGVVVANNLKEPECDTTRGCPLMYSQPSITLADTTATSRNVLYDIIVSFPEEARTQANEYPVGKTVTVTATVEGSIDGLRLTQ